LTVLLYFFYFFFRFKENKKKGQSVCRRRNSPGLWRHCSSGHTPND